MIRLRRQTYEVSAPRGATPRRLAAARRHLRKEVEAMPLFAAEVAAAQPTPEERIDGFDQGFLELQRGHRQLDAKHWREARAILRTYDLDEQNRIVAAWNSKWCPCTATFFLCFVNSWPALKAEVGEELSAAELQTLVYIQDRGRVIGLEMLSDAARLAAHKLAQRGLISKFYADNRVGWEVLSE